MSKQQNLTLFFIKLNSYLKICKEVKKTLEQPMKSGAIVDEQGKLNNFAIEPRMYVTDQPQFGFTPKAELLNGSLAMIGFVSLLVLEALTGQGVLGFLMNL